MKTIYRSKNFLDESRHAVQRHELLEIAINGGWRGRMLSKEVALWAPFDDIELIKEGKWKAPSAWCGLLMPALHAVHYIALTSNYEMRCEIDGERVVLIYVPL